MYFFCHVKITLEYDIHSRQYLYKNHFCQFETTGTLLGIADALHAKSQNTDNSYKALKNILSN